MTNNSVHSVLRLLSLAFCLPLSLFAQGSLTPPGPPAETGKSLGQIEPRTDVQKLSGDATATYIINAAGSYYLTGNITGQAGKVGIAITASDVTLDLNGFSLNGGVSATRAIEIRNVSNILVRNGSIRFWGAEGIASTGTPFSVRLEDLVITSTTGSGIDLSGNNHSVRRCSVRIAGASGIDLGSVGTVESCDVQQATGNSSSNIFGITAAIVKDSQVSVISNSGSGAAFGILASLITNCRASQISTPSGAVGLSGTQTVSGSSVFSINTTGSNAVTGIFGTNVSGCHANFIGTSGSPTTVFGIQATSVSNSSVSSIGTSATGAVTGVSASAVTASTASIVGAATASSILGITAGTVSDCTVSNIGLAGGPSALGIGGGGTVTGCRVQTVLGAPSPTGILADVVAQCTVSAVNQSSSGTGNAIAINADRVTDCHVTGVNGNSTSRSIGINAVQNVSNCSVTGIGNAQGSSAGIVATTAGVRVQNCSVINAAGGTAFGMVVIAGHVNGNTVDGVPTGISVSTGSTADGNNVTSCATGISAGTNSLVVRNHFRACATPISADGTCQTGPLESTTGVIANTNPTTNFRD